MNVSITGTSGETGCCTFYALTLCSVLPPLQVRIQLKSDQIGFSSTISERNGKHKFHLFDYNLTASFSLNYHCKYVYKYIHIHSVYVYIVHVFMYIYICVCVCVFV